MAPNCDNSIFKIISLCVVMLELTLLSIDALYPMGSYLFN